MSRAKELTIDGPTSSDARRSPAPRRRRRLCPSPSQKQAARRTSYLAGQCTRVSLLRISLILRSPRRRRLMTTTSRNRV
jgi:hypothetical protein